MKSYKMWMGAAILLAICGPMQAQEEAKPAEAAAEEPEPAVTVGADLALNSRYMFWGLTLSNKPVWQPDVWVSAHGFTFGVWGNFEFSKQSTSSSSDYTTGGDRSGNTEVDYWLEYALPTEQVAAKLGIIRWTYNRDNTGSLSPYATQDAFPGLDNGPDIDSTEIYGAITWSNVPLSPNLTLYYDADIYQGLFGWVSVTKEFPVGSHAISTQLLVGFSQGESNTGHKDIPLYVDEGLTHVDLAASLPLTAGATSITPNLHVQYAIDDAAKVSGYDNRTGEYRTDDWVVTAGVTFAWSWGLGGK